MALEGFQKRLLIVQSDVQTDAAFMTHGRDPPNFVPIAPVETLKQAYTAEHKDLWIAVANWASPMFNRVDTFAAYLQMFENVNPDAKLSTYFSRLSQTPDIKTDITVARAMAENDGSPLFSAATQVVFKDAFERVRAQAAPILSETLREEKDVQSTVLFRGGSTPSGPVENNAPKKRAFSPVPEELPDADDADLPPVDRVEEPALNSAEQFHQSLKAKWLIFRGRNLHRDLPNPLYAIMLLDAMVNSMDPGNVSKTDMDKVLASYKRLADVPGDILWGGVMDVSTFKAEVEDLANVLQALVGQYKRKPHELFINFDFLRFVTSEVDAIIPLNGEDYERIDALIPRVFDYIRSALADNAPVNIMDALEVNEDPTGVVPDINELFAETKNAQGQEMRDPSRRTSIARSMLRQGAPGGDPNPGNGTGIVEDLPFPRGAPRKRAAYDHTIVRVPMLRPMQPYYLIDMGYMDTTSGQFNGKSIQEIAIRQGDLIFRYKDKNSTPAVTVNWNRASFWGIAAAAKASFFAGDKVTFPVALGGGMSTINRAPSAVAPFDVLTPNAYRYTDEWMDNSRRRVGSLAHTFKEDPCIVSLNWAQPGHQLDVIVYY